MFRDDAAGNTGLATFTITVKKVAKAPLALAPVTKDRTPAPEVTPLPSTGSGDSAGASSALGAGVAGVVLLAGAGLVVRVREERGSPGT